MSWFPLWLKCAPDDSGAARTNFRQAPVLFGFAADLQASNCYQNATNPIDLLNLQKNRPGSCQSAGQPATLELHNSGAPSVNIFIFTQSQVN
jgi:hypothetical protein